MSVRRRAQPAAARTSAQHEPARERASGRALSVNSKTAVIDGYNVIRRVAAWDAVFRRDTAQAREALLAYCHAWTRRRHFKEVIVVFDGQTGVEGGPRQPRPGVRTVFTGSGEKADDRIARWVRDSAPGALTVISDDAEIVRTARAHRAQTMTVRDFHGETGARGRKPGPRAGEEKTPLDAKAAGEIDEMLRKAYGLDG